MALVSGRRSTLNPDAPLFIPAAFRQVEDFSPEWWQLVTTSTWYRDYWLSQHQGEDGFYDNSTTQDDDGDDEFDDVADLLPDAFDFNAAQDFEDFLHSCESEAQNKSPSFVLPSNGLVKDAEAQVNNMNMSWLKLMEERSPSKSSAEPAKYADKAAKAMNPRCSPRRIQQPR